MKNRNGLVMDDRNKSSGKWIYWMFFTILIFIAIYIPFFGSNLRYQTSYIFSQIFNILGTFSLTIGGLMVFFGFTGIFTKSRNWIRSLVLGGVLLWIGCWCLGIPSIWDVFSPGSGTGGSAGYH